MEIRRKRARRIPFPDARRPQIGIQFFHRVKQSFLVKQEVTMPSLRSLIAAVCFAVILFTISVPAQVNTSTIAGVVTDQTGSVVSNAKVVSTLQATGQQREAVTNSAGEYVFPQLAPGAYRVTVTATGFQTAVVDNLTLNIAERSTLNISLKLGQISEEVSVTATAPLLEQETASLGQVIVRKAINDLPLNGRNYITLGSLSPGVMPQLPT